MKVIKYLCGVSLAVLALTACGKKEQEQPSAPKEEVAVPTVEERPPVVCDDVALKNRVVNLLQDQVLNVALDALGSANNIAELEPQLRARLAETTIDVQNAQVQQGECHAQLHIVLSDKDVQFANKGFAQANLPNIAEQASYHNIALLGDTRLVADFRYQVDGEALSVQKDNPAVGLVANALAKSVQAMTKQNKANAKKEVSTVGTTRTNITPPPTVNLRPVERPRTPTPEEAILRPEDVPSGRPAELGGEAGEQVPAVAPEPRAENKPKPKAESKPKPKAETESKPEPKSEKSVPADDAQITIVESDETY